MEESPCRTCEKIGEDKELCLQNCNRLKVFQENLLLRQKSAVYYGRPVSNFRFSCTLLPEMAKT
jgi:hypothetical protein